MRKIGLITAALLMGLSLTACGQQTQKQKDESMASSRVESRKNYQSRLQGFAQAFGRKPVDTIQSMPSTYVTAQNSNGDTVYGWHPDGLPELVRVDSANNNTDVYLYDEHGQDKMLGEHIYHGRTIYQKPAIANDPTADE